MARAHHYRRRVHEPTELDVTTFLNLMVVLVPFLLITAVFSRITVVELDLPSAAGGPNPKEPAFRVEVIVRGSGIEIGNGTDIIAGVPKVDGEYDLEGLGRHMIALKREHPDSNQASVLLEPDIPYDYLIQVMDIVRTAELGPDIASRVVRDASVEGDVASDREMDAGFEGRQQLALFTQISVGEAP